MYEEPRLIIIEYGYIFYDNSKQDKEVFGADMKNEVIVVLGMSRSGTSCLTGLLEQVGVYLGDVRKWNRFNAKGNQENPKINSLQEDLFIANNGNWRSPPDMVIWSDIHKKIRDEIIRSYEGHGCWGLKDPRTLFCLEGWLEVLPSFKLIGAFRHPHHVAMSLNRRDNLPIEQGYQIWFRYNKKLLFYKNKYDFPVISFDSDNYLEKARKVIEEMNIGNRGEKFDFFDPSLRHYTGTPPIQLPGEVMSLYQELNRKVVS